MSSFIVQSLITARWTCPVDDLRFKWKRNLGRHRAINHSQTMTAGAVLSSKSEQQRSCKFFNLRHDDAVVSLQDAIYQLIGIGS